MKSSNCASPSLTHTHTHTHTPVLQSGIFLTSAFAEAACVMSFPAPPSTFVLSLLTTDNKVADLRRAAIPHAKILMRCIWRRSPHWFLQTLSTFVRWLYVGRFKPGGRVCVDCRSIAFIHSCWTLLPLRQCAISSRTVRWPVSVQNIISDHMYSSPSSSFYSPCSQRVPLLPEFLEFHRQWDVVNICSDRHRRHFHGNRPAWKQKHM